MPSKPQSFCIRCGKKIEDISFNKFLCVKCIKEMKPKDIPPVDSSETILDKKPIDEGILIPHAIDKRKLKDLERKAPKIWNKGDIILNLYEVIDILGEGGMGIVYKVYHRGWDINLAVKSPNEASLARAGGIDELIDEAETWINLGLHPNIVSCYYARELGNIPRIFIEFVDRGSLKESIKENRINSLEDILDIAIQSCWGLTYSHKNKIIHKDIKPQNILLTKDNTAKITDFGLAKARGLTREYCSPEQALGKELIIKTDIYSLALTILEMFIGERVWSHGEAAPFVLEDYIKGSIDIKYNLPNIPEKLIILLKRCFSEDINKRPEDMLEMSNELINIYKENIKHEYFRKKPEEVKLRADSLNNRALTLLDLGKIKDAENIWQKAIKKDSHHPEATYNLGLLQWRNARKTDLELVEQLKSVIENRRNDWRPYYLLGVIHLERGDKNSAEKLLKEAASLAPEVSDINNALINLTKIKNACCLRTFEGHKKYVNDIAITPDDKYFISASSDDTLKIWDINSGACLRTFVGHKDSIYAIAITLDGKYVVSGSDDNTLKLWDIDSEDCLRTFVGHKGWVNSVVITRDGQYIISGSSDKTLKLWDLNTRECLRTFVGHKEWVKAVDITWSIGSVNITTGKQYPFIISGSDDNTLKLWDLNSGNCLRSFWGHKYGINAIAISKDDRYVVSGSSDNTLKLWDLNSGNCLRTYKGHKNGVKDLAITPDERFIISGSLDNTIRLWDLNTGECVRTFEEHEDDVYAVAITQDGCYIVSSSRNNKLWLWRLEGIGEIKGMWTLNRPVSAIEAIETTDLIKKKIETARMAIIKNNIKDAAEELHKTLEVQGHDRDSEVLDLLNQIGIKAGKRINLLDSQCLHTFKEHKHRVNSIVITLDGRYAISGSGDRTLMLWDLNNLKYVRTFVGHKKNIEAVAISPDGCYVISGDDDMKLKLWDLNSRICLHTFEGHEGWLKDIHITPDGRYAISSSDDNTLKLWDLKSCECIQTFKGHKESVESVAITPDGEYVVSGSYDKTLKLWDLNNGKCLRTFEGHEDSVRTVVITPDGQYVVSGSNDMTLKLWNLTNGRCVRTFVGHKGWVNGVDTTSDGKYVISGSWDNTIKLWNMNSGECLRTFEEHKKYVNDIAVTPDCRYFISASSDKTIKLWRLDWDYEFPEKADWDVGVKPYLEIFLTLHTPYSTDGIKRVGKPIYTEEDFKMLLKDLGYRGFGWLKPEKIKQKLKEMEKKWKGSPADKYRTPEEPSQISISEYERKVKEIEKIIEDKRKADDTDGIARAYHDLGSLHLDHKKYSKAKAVFEKVLVIKEETDDKRWMATCYVNLGIANMYQGNYNQAEIMFNKGLTLSKKTNYKYLITLCYHNLGVLYDRHLNQPQDALEMYKACLKMREATEMPIPEWLEQAIQRLSKRN